jgi:flagellar motor switch protein FliN/FliY
MSDQETTQDTQESLQQNPLSEESEPDNVRPADLAANRFDEKPAAEGVVPGNREQNLELILDVPVTLSMELGRSRISIRDLLQLNQGSVVKLDRPAGEPLDVLVNGCLIARGEVVVVNERFGLRITQIVSPEQRVKKLQ